MPEQETVPEKDQLLERWRDVLHNEGALIVTSRFPEGKHKLGSTTIDSDADFGFQSFVITKSPLLSDLEYSSGDISIEDAISQQLTGRKQDFLENADTILISDFSKMDSLSKTKITDKLSSKKMLGVLLVSMSNVKYHDRSHHNLATFILPIKYLDEIVKNILDNPKLIRNLTVAEMPELDILDERKIPSTIDVRVNAKSPNRLFYTKVRKTFPV